MGKDKWILQYRDVLMKSSNPGFYIHNVPGSGPANISYSNSSRPYGSNCLNQLNVAFGATSVHHNICFAFLGILHFGLYPL